MNIRHIVLIMVLCMEAGCTEGANLPLLKDCIVGIKLQWQSGIPHASKARVVEEMIRNVYSDSKLEVLPLMASPTDDFSMLYAQYPSSCARRYRMAQRLMTMAGSDIPNMPTYEVLDREVQPGPETIQAWGPDWADHPVFVQHQ